MKDELWIMGEEDALAYMEKGEEHTFSKKYLQEKSRILGTERRHRRPSVRLLLLAAALAALAAMSVYAAVSYYTVRASKNENTGTYTYTFEAASDVSEISPIKITAGYIPAGYGECSLCGENKYQPVEGNDHKHGFSVVSANQNAELSVPYVSKTEHVMIGDVKADILTRKGVSYNHVLLLFHEEDGQVIEIFAADDISVEELKKIAENITYEKTESTEGVSAAFSGKENVDSNGALEKRLTVTDDQFISVGDTLLSVCGSDSQGEAVPLPCTVKDVTVSDKVPDGLDADAFLPEDGRTIDDFLNADRTFQTRQRQISCWEDNELKVKTETVKVQCVELVLSIDNPTDGDVSDVFVGDAVAVLERQEDGTCKIDEDGRYKAAFLSCDAMPFYFDQTDHPQDIKRFYFMNMKAGETKEVHLLYTVDEDAADTAYIGLGEGSAPEMGYLKIK